MAGFVTTVTSIMHHHLIRNDLINAYGNSNYSVTDLKDGRFQMKKVVIFRKKINTQK